MKKILIVLCITFIFIGCKPDFENNKKAVVIAKEFSGPSSSSRIGFIYGKNGPMPIVTTSTKSAEYWVIIETDNGEIIKKSCRSKFYYSVEIGDKLIYRIEYKENGKPKKWGWYKLK